MATPNGTSNGVAQDDLVMPLIDFSLFLHGTASANSQTASQVLHAFRTSGFLYLSNHGIPAPLISSAFRHSASFFSRPQAQKDSLAWTTPSSNRGYVTSGREKVTQSTSASEIATLRSTNPDLKESFEIGRDTDPDHPNRWPAHLDSSGQEFTTAMREFYLALHRLNVEVMRAIALGMSLDKSYFDKYTSKADNTLRLLHYPPAPKSLFQNNPDRVRAGAHSDYGSITLLFQDDVGGLEVQSPKGTWVRATPIKDTIVVNAGDLLARWSGDLIRSTRHRVVQPQTSTVRGEPGEEGEEEMYPERYSVAYFCNPNFDAWIETLPGTEQATEQGQGTKYEGVYSGEYLVQRLAATY